MSNIITARKLWYDGELSIGNCDYSINCKDLIGGTPRNAWLTPIPGCVGSTMYALNIALPPGELPDGTLQGVWLEFSNGKGMMIDAISVDAVITACNACCGVSTEVVPRYGGTIPDPSPLVAATYTFTRADNGDWYAYNKASLDYWPQYISGTFNKISHDADTGLTTYSFNAYVDPTWIGSDTFVSESPRVFTSGPLPTLTGSEVYVMTVINDGNPVLPRLTAASAAAFVTAANANASYSALGTYAVDTDSGGVKLTSSTLQNGQVIIAAVAPTVWLSNDPGAPSGAQNVSLSATIDGTTITPNKTAATTAALVTALNADAVYSVYGTWAAQGNAVKVTSVKINYATLVMSLID